MKTNYYVKLLSATVLVTVLYFLINFLFTSSTPVNISDILWLLLSNLLIVLVLAYYISHSALTGAKLVLSVFVIYYVIGFFNILIEAYIFNVTDRELTSFEMFKGIFIALSFSLVLVYLFKDKEEETESHALKKRSVFSWIWRVLVGILIYVIVYLLAGSILQSVYPALLDFYNINSLPAMDLIIFTQFPRGLLFVSIAILILCTMKGSLLSKAVVIGLVFAVFGAIAPLIPPNELMPVNIRIAHGIETGSSNFLYGMILAYLLGHKTEHVAKVQ